MIEQNKQTKHIDNLTEMPWKKTENSFNVLPLRTTHSNP